MTAAMLDKSLREFANEVDAEYHNPDNLYTREDRVFLLDAVRHCIQGLRAVEAEWEQDLVDATDERAFEVTGVGTVQIRRGSTRSKWDHAAIVPLVVARGLDERHVDPDTGESEPGWEAVTRALIDCAGIGYWRVNALKSRGIDPDEFCHKEPGQLKVTIT